MWKEPQSSGLDGLKQTGQGPGCMNRLGGKRGSRLGSSSQTLTADDFVPVLNGSEYINEKKLELLTFLLLESSFMVLWLCRSAMKWRGIDIYLQTQRLYSAFIISG